MRYENSPINNEKLHTFPKDLQLVIPPELSLE